MSTGSLQFRAAHPGVFFLDCTEIGPLEGYLQRHGLLAAGVGIDSAERAGAGNMNCTVRVTAATGSLIVKQARPWVEKYPQFAAPWDRACREAEFYERVSARPAVSRMMPTLYFFDPEARVLVLEDLGAASDYTGVYRGETFREDEVRQLAGFLTALHRPFSDGDAASESMERLAAPLTNREMRELNHSHLFVIPLTPNNGLALDAITPGLATAAQGLQTDDLYRREVLRLGREVYLADGPNLLHGDFFPGSLLRTDVGPRVIDPEFGFFGQPEFDMAVFLAHLLLANQPRKLAVIWREAYGAQDGFDDDLMWQLAGVEIMRRLIGYAQLPVGYGLGRKLELLELSRELVLEPRASRTRRGA